LLFHSLRHLRRFTMVATKTYRTLIASLFASLFVFFVAGCGGGSEDQTVTGTTPTTETFVDIEANPGPIVAVRVGEIALLDGSKSKPESAGTLSYNWSFTSKPDGSSAELQGAATASPSFIADVRGVYIVQQVVSAKGVTSQRAITTVVVTNQGERLTGRFNHPGLSSNCVNCHDGVFLQSNGEILFPKIPDHIAASNACQACHTPQGFNIIPFVDHQEVFGNCSECHNGTIAIGKSEFHPATDVECDSCHNTTSFVARAADGSFDHSNITRTCIACHNGTVATGKTPSTADIPVGTHPVTNTECGSCHTTLSFLNAYPDHTDPTVLTAGCDSCHIADGSGSAQGQSAGHPVTSVDCTSCHSILTFKMPGGVFNHSLLDATVQSCESCHNASTSINAIAATDTQIHRDTSSDCGVCHNTESFIPAFSIDHTGIVDNCATSGCHTGLPGEASGKPLATLFYEHIPTNEDCSVCHTPGTFSTGFFTHTGPSFAGSCDSCHNNVVSVGKLPNHIPTNPENQDCADCHNTIDFADVTFDHTGINVNNCASCHDGTTSIGKSVDHLPTTLDCSSCHDINNFVNFAGITFNHLGIDANNCASCHNTGIATPKKLNHIPALTECSVCHSDINTFASTTFLTAVHPDIISGCEGCHTSKFISNANLLKATGHLPTVQDCDVCHTNNTFTPSIFNHSGITGNCSSCHDGSASNVSAGARGTTPTHPATTADCGSCHAIGNNFTDGTFDHTGIVNNCSSCHGDNPTATPEGPRKNLDHVVTTEDCSLCHVTGTFTNAVFDHTGIVDNCVSCHDGSGAIATVKHTGHLATTEDCSLCHNTTTFSGARFDHQGIVDNCASCHDGATARGKIPPPDHVPTNDDCNVCHQTTGFKPATFAHIGIVDNCISCHDGKFATGKTNNHVLTNQDCGVCHTTTSFIGAGFNHTGIVDNCVSCHDGNTAIGMDAKTNPAHIATALDCHFCHTTATFVGGTWAHDSSSTGNCDQCHSPNGGATFKPQGHLNTTVQCDECHSTNAWAPTSFNHDPQGGYPGDHRRDPGCSGCHGNTVDNTLPYPHPQYAPPQRNTVYCAACHANDFEREGDHIGGKNGTVEQNKDCAGSGCHKVRDSGF